MKGRRGAERVGTVEIVCMSVCVCVRTHACVRLSVCVCACMQFSVVCVCILRGFVLCQRTCLQARLLLMMSKNTQWTSAD